MRSTRLIAAIAVASTFTLVACSSNGAAGNPSPTSTPGTSSAAATSGAAGSGSATAGTSAAGGGATESSSASGGSGTGSAGGSSQEETSTSTEESTITVGGTVDAQTAAWFGAFCTGMSPLVTTMEGGAIPTGGADMQATMVKQFDTLGDALTNTANALKVLPPPTFSNGTQFASDVVASLSQAGPQMKSAAADIKAVAAGDTAGLQAAIEKASTAMSSSMGGLDKYDLDTNTQDAMKNIPACAPFAAAAGGAGASATTTG